MSIQRFPPLNIPEPEPPRQPSGRLGAPSRIAPELPSPEPSGKGFDAIVKSEESGFTAAGPVN
jgi:hypothetical protein